MLIVFLCLPSVVFPTVLAICRREEGEKPKHDLEWMVQQKPLESLGYGGDASWGWDVLEGSGGFMLAAPPALQLSPGLSKCRTSFFPKISLCQEKEREEV